MSRWEFHLSTNREGRSPHWFWMYRPEGAAVVIAARRFATYRECLRNALLHGYRARHLHLAQDDIAAPADAASVASHSLSPRRAPPRRDRG